MEENLTVGSASRDGALEIETISGLHDTGKGPFRIVTVSAGIDSSDYPGGGDSVTIKLRISRSLSNDVQGVEAAALRCAAQVLRTVVECNELDA